MIFLLLLALSPLNVSADPLNFHANLRCDLNITSFWCAEVFYYDVDSFSKNDPMLFHKQCTSGKQLEMKTYDITHGYSNIFDEAFTCNYLINYVIFHNCNQNQMFHPEDEICHCKKHKQFERFASRRRINFRIDVDLVESNDEFHETRCVMPEAFRDLKYRHYNREFPNHGCTWDKYSVGDPYPVTSEPEIWQPVIVD